MLTNGSTVMIIEDDASILKLLEFILKKDYKLILAENGKIAYDKIKSGEKPDFILSDIMMPELNGLELKEKLNLDPELKEIPFIFLTALNEANAKEEMINLGATGYLVKPIKPSDLKDKIRNISTL